MLSLFIFVLATNFALNGGHPTTQDPCDNYHNLRHQIQSIVVKIDKSWNVIQNDLKQANCSPADLEQWRYYVGMLQGNYTELSKKNRELTVEVQKTPQNCAEAQSIIQNAGIEVPLEKLRRLRSKISESLGVFYAELTTSDKGETYINDAIKSFKTEYSKLRIEVKDLIQEIRSLIKKKRD
ncbi:hypothetical protein QAD02_006075 [Eretmocerus hayati]|uniref:Uncharacterized protein n=1 Tax=Eretmocerus hayati TaxID=131215 RepID=A0ACC2N0Z6_9HYME|nr:hypothetical protein QAD02_006075 [Eretmocerus hayati]